jgi:hypothetical protein
MASEGPDLASATEIVYPSVENAQTGDGRYELIRGNMGDWWPP